MAAHRSPARLDRLTPRELDADQLELYEAIAHGRRAQGPQLFPLVGPDGALEGPFNALLLSPGIGRALQAVGTAVRYDSELGHRVREIVILVVARHWDSAFERYAHEAVAADAGVQRRELAALRDGHFEQLGDPLERLAARTAAALAEDGDLDDATFAAAQQAFGTRGLFEITSVVGYYATVALQLRVYRVPAPSADNS